ncbi:MAG: hypothetical protein K6E10_00770 [Eubacterium sp.]|nr:hypothetical protein [Eubacterium sp.]
MFQRNGKSDVPFYEREHAYRNCGIVGLAGCGAMIAAAFLYWDILLIRTIDRFNTGVSFFSAMTAGFKGARVTDGAGQVLSTSYKWGNISPCIYLTLYFALILFMAYTAYMDNIAKKPFLPKWEKSIRLGMVVLTIILVIVLSHTKYYGIGLDSMAELKASWDSFIEMFKESGVEKAERMRCTKLIGPGVFFYIAGAGAYLYSVIYNFVLDTLNED